jgi:glycogen debranching enzyme
MWTAFDLRLVETTTFSTDEGDATGNAEFVCSPSLFNAILSHGLLLTSELTDDAQLRRQSSEIGEAMDDLLWNDSEGMYGDRPLVGGGPSSQVATLDGALSALGSVSREHAVACLDQLRDPTRFAAPFGLRYLPLDHPDYQPNLYWRGSAWPQLTFLAVVACKRWGLDKLADEIAQRGRTSIEKADWSEHWNPESGEGLGARPQTWASLAAAL